jgi:hypothetical protein
MPPTSIPDSLPPDEPDPAPGAVARRRRRARLEQQLAAAEAALRHIPAELPPSPVAPPELLESIAAEAEQLEALEFFLCDLQRFPLGPATAAEVARVRGLLLNLSAAAAALQNLDLRR